MAYYPIFLALRGRPCVVVGGGPVAERKVEGLLRAGASVGVVAPDVTPGIARLAAEGRIALEQRAYAEGDLAGATIAIAATDDTALQGRIAAEAKAEGALLNVVDAPELCDFIAPAVLERGDLQVALSSAGAAPALVAALRDRLAESIGPEYGLALELLRAARERLQIDVPDAGERRRILVALATSDLPERIRSGDRSGVDRALRSASGGRLDLGGLAPNGEDAAWTWRP